MRRRCALCGDSNSPVSNCLKLCKGCIVDGGDGAEAIAAQAHASVRRRFNLPEIPPRSSPGRRCSLCQNACKMAPGEVGYCGIRRNESGRIVGGGPKNGKLSWYYDPLPTNCVASWVCPAETGCGYPKYAFRRGPEWGFNNLAVFYHACSFNCLFCQNWHFRNLTFKKGTVTALELSRAVRPDTACICYFGGDPTPQMTHSIKASEIALRENDGRILRVCWETNGSMERSLLEAALRISLRSGGCIKFDLKAWDGRLHRALCGVGNVRTLENFHFAAGLCSARPEVPLVVASTLLVPGYIDEDEVGAIARFIASIDPDIPYSLLAFHPQFFMDDLPITSRRQAFACKERAEREGLRKVRIGNIGLLC